MLWTRGRGKGHGWRGWPSSTHLLRRRAGALAQPLARRPLSALAQRLTDEHRQRDRRTGHDGAVDEAIAPLLVLLLLVLLLVLSE